MTQTPYAGGSAWAGGAPSSRYILPQFEERTSYGTKRQDPYTKLFEDRIIFLGVQVDDASADDIIAQLIVLESQDPDRDILMYINSPGGSFTALTAIYDTMQYIKPDVQTFVIGQAASAAAVLLAAGAPGKRFALPNARVLIHQPESTLPLVMAEMVRTSARWVLCGEYYGESTEEVPYRGNEGALFRRDFGGAFAELFPELTLHSTGFLGRDEGWDDITWWLFERR